MIADEADHRGCTYGLRTAMYATLKVLSPLPTYTVAVAIATFERTETVWNGLCSSCVRGTVLFRGYVL